MGCFLCKDQSNFDPPLTREQMTEDITRVMLLYADDNNSQPDSDKDDIVEL